MKGGDGSPSSARRKELRWLLAALCLVEALIVLLLVETALHFFAWGLAGLALFLLGIRYGDKIEQALLDKFKK
mgnify:CR=1 FL=1